MTRWLFDLDNTLVKTDGSNYKDSTPIPEAIDKIRAYKKRGDHIIIMTARGASSKTDWREFTAKQLDEFGIPYDQLIVGLKPGGIDYFIDDKAVNANDWLKNEEEALKKVKTKEHTDGVQVFDPLFPYAHSILEDLGIDPTKYSKREE